MNYTNIFYSIGAALMALFLMYLDTKILDNPKTKASYAKGMLMTGLCTWIILTFIESDLRIEEVMLGEPGF
jgi:hypothetical protein